MSTIAITLPSRRPPAPLEAWLTRLAAWAERQPRHRRMGVWTAL
jgi:hypothetical protein